MKRYFKIKPIIIFTIVLIAITIVNTKNASAEFTPNTYYSPTATPSFPERHLTWNIKEILETRGTIPTTTIKMPTISIPSMNLTASAIMSGNDMTPRSFFPHSFLGWIGAIILILIVMLISRRFLYEPITIPEERKVSRLRH